MWRFHNPVDVKFGSGCLATLPERLNGRRYALVTYDEPFFAQLTETITTLAGAPQVVINNVEPNPDIINLEPLCKQLSSKGQPEVIVALGRWLGYGYCQVSFGSRQRFRTSKVLSH